MSVDVLASLDEAPGWDRLLAGVDRFYLSRDWLAFADGDGEAVARYCLYGGRECPVAGLPGYQTVGETNPEYVPSHQVPHLAGAQPQLLTLGGRRGYLSAVLAPDRAQAAAALPELVDAAMDAFEPPPAGWWWPFLETCDAQTLRDALASRPMGAALIDADCVLDLQGDCVDDYASALPDHSRRNNVRREMRRFAESGLVVTARTSPTVGSRPGRCCGTCSASTGTTTRPSRWPPSCAARPSGSATAPSCSAAASAMT